METSVSERGEKEVRDCVFVVMKLLIVCGVRNWSLMVFVLFVKKVAKSSAVRVDEGGGGDDPGPTYPWILLVAYPTLKVTQ